MAKHPAVDALAKAAKGLMFPSESESPLEPFLWPGDVPLSVARLLELAGAAAGTPVAEVSLATLFRTIPKDDRPSFDRLQAALSEQVSGLKVYKVGAEAEKQVYIVGRTSDGQLAGLKTTVVET